MRIKITLNNSGGELDSEIIENRNAVDPDDMSDQIQDVISRWTLSEGDTITIVRA